MHFLLTNDDGIDAPGLAALEAALEGLGRRTVVAPATEWSGCGHRLTTDRPLTLEERSPRRHALDGTPGDCTRVALTVVAPQVDWVVAGVNAGGNLGADVFPSGTVAAVREAVLLGKPGIALSHYRRRDLPFDWERAAQWAREVVARLVAEPWRPGTFWNVNFPHLPPECADPELVFCELDPHPLPVAFESQDGKLHYRGRYADRPRRAGCDVEVCFSGRISVTRIAVHSTHG